MFVSIDLLGPKMIRKLPQYMPEYLLDPYFLTPEVVDARKYEEKEAKIFSSLESLPFAPKTCVFNNLLGPKELIF